MRVVELVRHCELLCDEFSGGGVTFLSEFFPLRAPGQHALAEGPIPSDLEQGQTENSEDLKTRHALRGTYDTCKLLYSLTDLYIVSCDATRLVGVLALASDQTARE